MNRVIRMLGYFEPYVWGLSWWVFWCILIFHATPIINETYGILARSVYVLKFSAYMLNLGIFNVDFL